MEEEKNLFSFVVALCVVRLCFCVWYACLELCVMDDVIIRWGGDECSRQDRCFLACPVSTL